MRISISIAAVLALASASSVNAQATSAAGVEGITPITLRNVNTRCVNINKHSVTFIITAVNVSKRDSLFKKVQGAGGKTDVQMISSDPSKTYSYPAQAAINVRDLGDGIIRAPIAMTILRQYEFAPSGTFKEIQIPFSLLKREGESDIAKYSRALIAFTAKNGSAIPVPGLATGASLVKDLSDGFFGQLDEARSTDFQDPDFRVAYQLSASDVCPGPQFLHSGIFAQIKDTKLEGTGIIKTADQDDYCFYVYDANSSSPRIGFIKRSGTCPSSRPDNLIPLNNPQMVYVVLITEKATTRKLAATIGRYDGGLSAFTRVKSKAATPSILQAEPSLSIDEISEMAEICDVVGLLATDCFPEADVISSN
jgi:hypothetical protein